MKKKKNLDEILFGKNALKEVEYLLVNFDLLNAKSLKNSELPFMNFRIFGDAGENSLGRFFGDCRKANSISKKFHSFELFNLQRIASCQIRCMSVF